MLLMLAYVAYVLYMHIYIYIYIYIYMYIYIKEAATLITVKS